MNVATRWSPSIPSPRSAWASCAARRPTSAYVRPRVPSAVAVTTSESLCTVVPCLSTEPIVSWASCMVLFTETSSGARRGRRRAHLAPRRPATHGASGPTRFLCWPGDPMPRSAVARSPLRGDPAMTIALRLLDEVSFAGEPIAGGALRRPPGRARPAPLRAVGRPAARGGVGRPGAPPEGAPGAGLAGPCAVRVGVRRAVRRRLPARPRRRRGRRVGARRPWWTAPARRWWTTTRRRRSRRRVAADELRVRDRGRSRATGPLAEVRRHVRWRWARPGPHARAGAGAVRARRGGGRPADAGARGGPRRRRGARGAAAPRGRDRRGPGRAGAVRELPARPRRPAGGRPRPDAAARAPGAARLRRRRCAAACGSTPTTCSAVPRTWPVCGRWSAPAG